MSKGKFIVFEGLDRCGKSTAINKLYERLSPTFPTKSIRFPNRGGEVGVVIDRYLRKEVKLSRETIHMLYSSDRYEHRAMIEEYRRDNIVLCDRYSMSGIAYSAAKGLDLEWCKGCERLLPKPDLTVFIDTPMEELARSSGFGDEVHDSRTFQEKVYSVYRKLLRDEDNVLIVDGTLPVEEIVETVARRIFE